MIGRPDYTTLYVQLGRLLEGAPQEQTYDAWNTPSTLQWLGRAHALIDASGLTVDAISFSTAVTNLHSAGWKTSIHRIFAILYRALGHCEIHAGGGAAGSFIPVGNSFDAFTALSKLLQSAKTDVMIVDPYLDETALTEFGLTVPEGVTLRLLTDDATHKASLLPAAAKWVAQYAKTRPLAVRLAPPKALHDRAIFVDRSGAWTLTQSLKDFAKRSPAEIVRADATAGLKIDAYESIWAAANVAL